MFVVCILFFIIIYYVFLTVSFYKQVLETVSNILWIAFCDLDSVNCSTEQFGEIDIPYISYHQFIQLFLNELK